MFNAEMRRTGQALGKVTIRNLSSSGVGARATGRVPEAGDTVFLDLGPFGAVEGRISWVSGDRFGIALAHKIVPENFDFSGKDWSVANRPFDQNHVFEQFQPVTRAGRPRLKIR